jgi:hypothetical protein
MIVTSVPSNQYNYIAAGGTPVKRVLQNASRVAISHMLVVSESQHTLFSRLRRPKAAVHHRRGLRGRARTPCLLRSYRPLSPHNPDIRKIAPYQELAFEVALQPLTHPYRMRSSTNTPTCQTGFELAQNPAFKLHPRPTEAP